MVKKKTERKVNLKPQQTLTNFIDSNKALYGYLS
jgi:hypothetical protein